VLEKHVFINAYSWHNRIFINFDWKFMNFETFIRYKTLDQVYKLGNHSLVDLVLSQNSPADIEASGMRKIQFDAANEMFQDLEEVVSVLSMSKREFLEAAVNDALLKAHQIIDEEKLMERMGGM
jgi:hypothetical protein